jgi:hypothetical protein
MSLLKVSGIFVVVSNPFGGIYSSIEKPPDRSWGQKGEVVTPDYQEDVGDLQSISGRSGRG